MAAEVCDLPGESDGETGFHHSMAYGETAGMNRQGIGEAGMYFYGGATYGDQMGPV